MEHCSISCTKPSHAATDSRRACSSRWEVLRRESPGEEVGSASGWSLRSGSCVEMCFVVRASVLTEAGLFPASSSSLEMPSLSEVASSSSSWPVSTFAIAFAIISFLCKRVSFLNLPWVASIWKTETGRDASGVLLRISGGGLSVTSSMKLDFPVPAAPYRMALLMRESKWPSFMASLKWRRYSLEPKNRILEFINKSLVVSLAVEDTHMLVEAQLSRCAIAGKVIFPSFNINKA